jgi:hypothetical protein
MQGCIIGLGTSFLQLLYKNFRIRVEKLTEFMELM